MKRILSVLTVICCLAGGIGPLRASAAPDETSETNPRIVFTNEPVEAADLYVIKELVSSDPQYAVPEDKKDQIFGFTLKLNGSSPGRITYHVYEDGVELFDGTSGGMNNSFKTGIDGSFQMKAGWTVVFKSQDHPMLLRDGVSYTVTEDPLPEGYHLAEARDAEGSIGPHGATAHFINEYDPEGTGDEAVLYVTKRVSFPSGYEMPDTPDFEFQLKLNNQVCSETSYDVMDGIQVKETKTTDENGIFTLKGGETVRFTTFNNAPIRTGMQYEVREVNLPDGWRAIGENAVTGGNVTVEIGGQTCNVAAQEQDAMKAATRLTFQNVTAAFRVSKRVKGTVKPDQDFTFELTHGDRTIWGGAKYYRYDANGKLIRKDGETDYFETDEEGHFTLKHGQTAVFFGFDDGDIYNVRELLTVPGDGTEDAPLYVQNAPKNPPYYNDKEVSDNAPEWAFENIPAEETGLRVTKSVINTTGEIPFKEADFSFKLYKGTETDGSWSWAPVPTGTDFIRTENGVKAKGKTGEDGSFTLKADGVIVFPYLEAGRYKVVEDVEGNPEYRVLPPEDPDAETTTTQEIVKDLPEDGTVTFAFENYYTSWKYDLRLVKEDGEENRLAGAKFELYWDEAQKNPVVSNPEETPNDPNAPNPGPDVTPNDLDVPDPEPDVTPNDLDVPDSDPDDPGAPNQQPYKTFTTDENGIATIQNLKAGTYILKEAKAPSGYAIIFAPIKLDVTRTADGIQVVLDDGNADPEIIRCTKTEVSGTNANDLVEVTVYNTELYELPSSGGIGIYWYSIGGTLLMLAAVLILYKYQRRGRC